MTQEEAIAEIKYYMESDSYADAPSNEACQMAINTLRPVSWEQVERMKGVWIFNDDWWGFQCSECHKGIGNIEKYKFCPHCGAPMTDESVDIVIERREALQNEIR